MGITVPDDYGWVLFEAALIVFQMQMTVAPIGSARKKCFTKKFFSDNFPELKDPPVGGAPDNGMGRFADKLSWDNWFLINNAQRSHLNFVEGIAPILVSMLVSGLFYTRLTVVLGIIYMIGRFLYSLGFVLKGAKARGPGFGLLIISQTILNVAALYGSYNAGGGLQKLISIIFTS